jgi:hypothetical protein
MHRRTFIGSAAAAGVGAAVGGALFLPTFDTHAQGHAAADPILAELQKQLAETVMAVRKGRGKAGEHARRIAANIRLLNVHGGIPTAADAHLQRLLRQDGRDALLAREIDPESLAREMKPFGVDRVPTLTATYADRARMLDATASNGAASILATLSTRFDQIAPALDRYAGTRAVARQDVDECWESLLVLTGIESALWEWCALNMPLCTLLIWFYLAWASFMCTLGCACIV